MIIDLDKKTYGNIPLLELYKTSTIKKIRAANNVIHLLVKLDNDNFHIGIELDEK